MTTNPTRQEPSAYGIAGAAGRLYWDTNPSTQGVAIRDSFGVVKVELGAHPGNPAVPAWLLTIQPDCDADETWLPCLSFEDAAAFGSPTAGLFAAARHVGPNQILIYLSGIGGSSAPVGPAGWPAHGELLALMPPDNAATVAPGAPVLFSASTDQTGGVVQTPPAGPGLTLPVLGLYRVRAQVSVDEGAGGAQLVVAVQTGGVGLFSILPDTVVGRATGTNQIELDTVILNPAPNSVIQLWNPPGNAVALTITPIAGGTHPVSATFSAELLATSDGGGSVGTTPVSPSALTNPDNDQPLGYVIFHLEQPFNVQLVSPPVP